ncbi:MAG TPA: formate dehydrogenase accessory sulfurtransferase FdhD [Gemmatimonadaceae bacterium]|nr:formate dehydrogenase accessory sulfurtransferase FdhD [Gemmatimonadaceae bacterium]
MKGRIETRPATAAVEITTVREGDALRRGDHIAIEEPLEVRLHGEPFAVIMRTPGDDEALTAGFLFSERVIWAPGDVDEISPCAETDHPHASNIINVKLAGRAAGELQQVLAGRRQVVTNASCGMCGRVSIESLQVHAPHVDAPLRIDAATVCALPDRLRRRQGAFDETGGLHAAGFFRPDGECVMSAEDVGRHNAVDKIVGRALLSSSLPASRLVLVVSGRTSFEIVQKAFLAGVPAVVAVSAPSSLAVQLADAAGITLVGFAREGAFNIYSHPNRIT